MKAIQIAQFGTADRMQVVDIESPNVSDNEIKVKIIAAGINPLDCKIREGSSFLSKKLEPHLPIGLGYDLSGVIVEVGNHITTWQVGDEVVGTTKSLECPGSYAEYAIVSPNTIVKKPAEVSFEIAAALPTPASTAWLAVNDYADVKPGERVLIHAGAGSVGHLAVQLAKQRGAHVISTAKKSNHAFLTRLGVEQTIDYTNQDFCQVVEPVDKVIDLVGGQTGLDSVRVIKDNGILVTVPTFTQEMILEHAKAHNIKAVGFVVYDDMTGLEHMVKLVANNQLDVNLDSVVSLDDVVEAHKTLQSGKANGKLVIGLS